MSELHAVSACRQVLAPVASASSRFRQALEWRPPFQVVGFVDDDEIERR